VSTPALQPRRERRLPVRTIGAVSASVIAFPLLASPAQAATTYPYPKPSRTLPSALDVAPFYQEGTRCLTENQPGAVAFAKLLNATYGSHVYGILRKCAAEHGEGRALDWMIDSTKPANLALANALTRWLAAPDAQGRPGAMARRFGINYIIFNRQQWKAWAPERGWTAYYGVSPHTDHIHFSFNWDGAYKRTSWWSGVAVTKPLTGPTGSTTTPPPPATTPAPAPALTASGYPLLVQGASGADVVLAQKVVGVTADGRFGPLTAAAIGTWQSKHGVPATKKLDNPTWATMVYLKLVPARSSALSPYVNVVLRKGSTGTAVKALQKAIGKLTVDGSYGRLTEARVKEYQKSKGLTVTGVTDAKVWKALMASTTPAAPAPTPAPASTFTTEFTAVKTTTLKVGSTGSAVKVLQRALGGMVVDGSYRATTATAVKKFQTAHKLTATGVVDGRTWAALELAVHPLLPYWGTVLKSGSKGAAVVALQKALRIKADGTYGPTTVTAVKALQKAAKLTQTGVVGTVTWKAVEARMPR
jgi:peptidoglycan hydrolase-like protein with peptidoglycan-binding domain